MEEQGLLQRYRGKERVVRPEVRTELQSFIEQGGWEEGEKALLVQLPWGKVWHFV